MALVAAAADKIPDAHYAIDFIENTEAAADDEFMILVFPRSLVGQNRVILGSS